MKKIVMREKREWGFEGFREIWIVKSCILFIEENTIYIETHTHTHKCVPLILALQVTNANVTN